MYKISWDNCEYYYIGVTAAFKGRKATHISALKHKKHDNKKLQWVYDGYGMPEFEIIRRGEISRLKAMEKELEDNSCDNKYLCNYIYKRDFNKSYLAQ